MEIAPAELPIDCSQLIEDVILHEDDLNTQGKMQFPYHREILGAFQLYRRTLLENEKLTRAGRHVLLLSLNEFYTTYKNMLNYVAVNTELLCGNLPKVAPLVTDMSIEYVPLIARSDTVDHERRAVVAKSIQKMREQLTDRTSICSASHPTYTIEEDFLILHQAGISNPLTFANLVHHVDLDVWFYNGKNKNFAYDYHNMFLRMLNSVDEPCSHWLLKSPEHALYLDTLLRHYPHAAIIMTHRNLNDVVPSLCRLLSVYNSIRFEEEGDVTSQAMLTTRTL
jgi:hypothetical protein